MPSKIVLNVVARFKAATCPCSTDKKPVAVAPPEWEGTVKEMKKHPEIDNPWALAWSMKNKGMTPHHE